MKLPEWAKKQGISYRTALRWFHGGTLPVEAEQMSTGTIIVCDVSGGGAKRNHRLYPSRLQR